MRRSEMLQAIRKELDGKQISIDYANQFLTIVEKLGMLPPKLGQHVSIKIVHDAKKNVMDDLSWYMWEPEEDPDNYCGAV